MVAGETDIKEREEEEERGKKEDGGGDGRKGAGKGSTEDDRQYERKR